MLKKECLFLVCIIGAIASSICALEKVTLKKEDEFKAEEVACFDFAVNKTFTKKQKADCCVTCTLIG